MKTLLKSFIIWLLAIRAKKVIQNGAEVLAITGSMGKTTSKNILTSLLSKKYNVLASPEGFNTPIGILLTLLDEKESGFSSPLKWFRIIFRVFTKTLPNPQKIILEFGVDRPGDMDELLRIIHPSTVIVTGASEVHLGEGNFRNLQEIVSEKAKLPKSLKEDGRVLLNGDDENIIALKENLFAKIFSYGEKEKNTIRILDSRNKVNGTSFVYSSHNGERHECIIPTWGSFFPSLFIPCIFLARTYGISFEDIDDVLKNFTPSPGRGRILEGINESIIWDQSYNSNPKALKCAIFDADHIPAQKKIALLGTMNELGEKSGEFHFEAGKSAALVFNSIYFVGSHFEEFQKGVQSIDEEKELYHFQTSEEAGNALKQVLQKGDFLLAKGSQGGIFLERGLEILLRYPEEKKLLCRRNKEWGEKYI